MYIISKISKTDEEGLVTDVFVVHNRRTGKEHGRYDTYTEASARIRELSSV